MDGFTEGWQGCSEGFSNIEAQGNSLGAALSAQQNPRPSRLSYSDLLYISNRCFQLSKKEKVCGAETIL